MATPRKRSRDIDGSEAFFAERTEMTAWQELDSDYMFFYIGE